MFDIIWSYKEGFLRGASVTFQIAGLVWIIGILGALIIVFLDTYLSLSKGTKKIKSTYLLHELFQFIQIGLSRSFNIFSQYIIPGIPILVLLYWFYYPVQQELETSISPFWISIIVLSLVNIVSTSFIMKGIINDLPTKYIESARQCGLSKNEIFFQISLPLIIRASIGPVLLIQISMLHNSIFASLINVKDILWQSKLINSEIHKPIEIFTILALFFLAFSIPLIVLSNYFKNKYTKNYTIKYD